MTTRRPVEGNRLRVAYFLAGSHVGGAEGQVLELAARLPRDRFDVEVVTTVGGGRIPPVARAAGLRVHSVGRRPASAAARPLLPVHRAAKTLALVAHARGRRYDVVDARLYPFHLLAALTRGLTRTSVVVVGRRTMQDLEGPRGTVGRHLRKLANRMSDAVVACSEAVAEDVRRHERVGAGKLRVIPNGVELPEPLSAEQRVARRGRMGVPRDALVIGCVARYDVVKRQDLVIDAFAALAAEHADAHLVLVGEGPPRASLEDQVRALGLQDRIRLLGWADDAKALAGAFDVAVHAASSEGLPNAVLEAAAAGVPIVATAAGGTPEVVVDGVTGLLVPVGDVESITRGIRRLLVDRDLAARLGRSARDHVAQSFGMDRLVSRFGDLYEELWRARLPVRAGTAAYPRAPDSAR